MKKVSKIRKSISRIVICMLASTTFLGYSAILPSTITNSLSAYSITANAAVNFKCYTIRNSNTDVYSTTTFTKNKKIGTIYGSDEITIIEYGSNYIKVRYPITGTNKYKEGYIKISDIIVTTKGNTKKSARKITTYKRPNGATYGYIDINDTVWIGGTNGNYTQVRYNITGGYKIAWILTNEAKQITLSANNNSNKAESLANKAKSQVGYQGTKSNGSGQGDYTKYGKWMKQDGVAWCAEFVSWCANQTGISTSVVPKTASTKSMINSSNSYCSWSYNNYCKMKRGDVIFFSKNSSKSGVCHVGIVESINRSNNQITVIEGNTRTDQVKKNTYTVNSNNGKITKGWNGYYFCGYISVK